MHDVFFFTDIHGMGCLYNKIMDYCLKEDPECTIIFGGDACDRGPDGYRIMQELLNNPRVVYLKGNHEDMFIHAAIAIKKDYKEQLDKEHIENYIKYQCYRDYGLMELQLCVSNGGFDTIRDWMLDGMPEDIIERLVHLPVTFNYNNIDFCHAGGQYKVFKRIEDAYYYDQPLDEEDVAHVLWDRNCFCFGWAPGKICVHGHKT